MPDTKAQLRDLPSVNELLDAPALEEWNDRTARPLIVEAARAALDEARDAILHGNGDAAAPNLAALAERAAARLEQAAKPALASVINATGIIIHTGLGRAPLAEAAVDALADVALHYAPVELDMPTGQRGKRTTLVEPLLCSLTGAEAATVVNNGAAGLLIILTALAHERQVIVSRGELIEIGGSFRLPDVMAASGAVLREVGTTNKTRLSDYENAIDFDTAALLKVHPSNYVINGFTEQASIAELAALGEARDLPVIHDIGSGALVDFTRYGLPDEPVARASIEAGADLVLFSGDKLLGGPQAGVIVGRRDLVERINAHPLMRAMRVDKLTLAALAATLQLHRDPDQAMADVPVLSMIHTPVDALRDRATTIVEALRDHDGLADAAVADTTCYLGGGSLPTQGIASVAVQLRPAAISEHDLAARLRTGEPAIVARVSDGCVLLELRTVFPQEDAQVIKAVQAALASKST